MLIIYFSFSIRKRTKIMVQTGKFIFDDDDQMSDDDEQLPPSSVMPPPIPNVQSSASIVDANDDGMHASEPDDELPPVFTYVQRPLTAVCDDYSFVMAGSFERGQERANAAGQCQIRG